MGGSAATKAVTRSTHGDVTRQQLVDAAIETLKDHGFAGASARVIADRAGINQGLIFYHFDSVTGLLLAALDRGQRYPAGPLRRGGRQRDLTGRAGGGGVLDLP